MTKSLAPRKAQNQGLANPSPSLMHQAGQAANHAARKGLYSQSIESNYPSTPEGVKIAT